MLVDNLAENNRHNGFVLYDSDENQLEENRAVNNGGAGVDVVVSSSGNFLNRNSAMANGLGFRDDGTGSENSYTQNLCTNNASDPTDLCQ